MRKVSKKQLGECKRQTKSEQIASKERKKKQQNLSQNFTNRNKKSIGAVSGVRNAKKDMGRKRRSYRRAQTFSGCSSTEGAREILPQSKKRTEPGSGSRDLPQTSLLCFTLRHYFLQLLSCAIEILRQTMQLDLCFPILLFRSSFFSQRFRPILSRGLAIPA